MPVRSSIIQLYIIWTVRSIVGDIDPLSSSRRLVISLHGKMLQQSISEPEMKISIISAMFIDNSTMMRPPYRNQLIGNVRETYRNKKKNWQGWHVDFNFFWMNAHRTTRRVEKWPLMSQRAIDSSLHGAGLKEYKKQQRFNCSHLASDCLSQRNHNLQAKERLVNPVKMFLSSTPSPQ